jgi:hypothetical protein
MLMVMMLKVAYHVDPTAATGSCAVLVVGGERFVLTSRYSYRHAAWRFDDLIII